MTNNYFTLFKLTQELRILVGSKLVECFSQEKGSLILCFYKCEGLRYLQFNTQPQIVSLYLRNNYNRAGKNTIDLFQETLGEIVKNIDIIKNERIIKFELIHYDFYFVLFGASKTNLFLTNKNGITAYAFKSSNKYVGKEFNFQKEIKNDFENTEIKLKEWITKYHYNIGGVYADEITNALQIDPNMKLSEIKKEDLQNIENEVERLTTIIENSKRYYVYKIKNKYVLSLIALQNQAEEVKHFEILSEAIEYKITKTLKDKHFKQLYTKYEEQILKMLIKIEKKIEKIEKSDELAQKARKYKFYGDLLISQADINRKGLEKITLDDWDGNSIVISLQKELNLRENAQKYYDKAKSYNENIIELKRLQPQLTIKKELFEKCYDDLRKAKSSREVMDIIAKYNIEEKSLSETNSPSSRFRIFSLGKGFTLYVGKNAKSNDELTMKFAKPNDLWFHARGAEGSHSVLKCDKIGNIPKEIIEKSAQITAYYSKARNSKYTPVCYTYRKYVHKPKGANPGTVTITREEVIMVEPKLND